MTSPTTTPTVLAVLAQGDPAASIGAKMIGLATQAAAALAAFAVAAILCILIWQLLTSAFKNPSIEKFAGIVAACLVAAFFVGAAPSLLDAAYAYGRGFMGGGQ